MEDIGIITRGKRGQYRPGLLLLSISRGVRLLDLLRDAGAPILKDLAESLNLAAHLAVSENGKMICVGRHYSAPATPARFCATWKVPAERVLSMSNGGRTETFTGRDGASPLEIRSVSAAVRDSRGGTIAAISASDAVSRMTPVREVVVKRALLDAANRLQDLLYRDVGPAKRESNPPTSAHDWTETADERVGAGFGAPVRQVSLTAQKRL
jgi:DNA-binding IclR family transcriptional regulator